MIYYRVQPVGLGLGHCSESSNGETADLHVFATAGEVFHLDAAVSLADVRRVYGGEVVEIAAPESWNNGDVEGVAIDPAAGRIVRRWSLEEFAVVAARELYDDAADLDGTEAWSLHRRHTNPADLEAIP